MVWPSAVGFDGKPAEGGFRRGGRSFRLAMAAMGEGFGARQFA